MSQSSRPSRSRSSYSRGNSGDSTLLSSDNEFNNTSADVDSSSTLLTSALSTTHGESDSESKVTKQMIERKQLLHDLELLKIELSQRNLIIDNMKAEHMNKVEELEEQVSDHRHAKQMIQARLESQLRLQQEDSRKKLENMRQELNSIMRRQQQLETDNVGLQEKAGDLRSSLENLELLSGERYLELKSTVPEQLNLKDFVAVKIYEACNPYKLECESQQQQIDLLSRELQSKIEEAACYQKEAEQERVSRSELEYRAQRLNLQIDDLKSRLNKDTYQTSNFDNIRGERDLLDREVMDLKKTNTVLEANLKSKIDELGEYQKEMQATKQSLALLKQDKEYLNKQVQELSTRSSLAEEQLGQVTKQLNDVKQAREELYEKYISTREQYKSEYEVKLKGELDQISLKTQNELEKIRSDTRDMYDRENRNLRESRDNAEAEKQRAVNSEKEITERHNQLLAEFSQLQVTSDGRQSELLNELKLKQFEVDRLQLLLDDTAKNLKQAQLDYEKAATKNEVLSKEFYALQRSSDKRLTELESRCTEQTTKLGVYEGLERELDDVIMQAAEIDNEAEAERVLFAYGYGANVPSTAKRRMQQSVHLARRVLQLERANTSLKNELDRETKKRDHLAQELGNATTLLNEAQQPYNYLIESIRTRDQQNQGLKEQIAMLQDDLKKVKQGRDELTKTKNEMAQDLERLLNQREEMSVMRQVVLGLQPTKPKAPVTRTSTAVHAPQARARHTAVLDTNYTAPKPTIFTRSEPPSWYRKLKSKR
ncbi:progesterone-induced-blocking factor 1 isoform X1 [Nematostella vectensis]|uniref:progesterone-induced-blocking factor 1 isoform X1 n=1 Tax=Nematostella vectensis TaxID=45351 RepID=UPI0020776C87|nr:progesterone-induced-blocking factor 1 isoform X1 [Nematostella vectensis]